MRHNKLGLLASSIAAAQTKCPHDWEIEWRVRFMPRKRLPDNEFSPSRDDLLWGVKNGYWIYVSDDNFLHPELCCRLAEIIKNHGHQNGVMFAQRLPDGRVRKATKEQLTTGDCEADGGQFVINGGFYSALGWEYHKYGPLERNLFKAIHDLDPDKFFFCNESYTYRDAQEHIWHLPMNP